MIRPPVSAAQTCVPFPYGAGQQDQILKGQPCRQDLLAATERRDLLFCTARPGVRFHAGAAETYRFRPAPSWGRVQSAGTAILRMDGDITHGRQDATGFHRFVWIVGNAPRIGIKRGRGVSPTPQVIGNPKLVAVLRPCRPARKMQAGHNKD